ncbi:MAG: hypothetical protein JO144_09025 [Actinobacteria bacterium]|nr:hypothetical protein [Actinomycetota bacterium]
MPTALTDTGTATPTAALSSSRAQANTAPAVGERDTPAPPISLNERPARRTGAFYLTYVLVHIAGAVLVLSGVDLIALSVDVQVMNALLLPIVLGFLLALEARALPPSWRMRGARRYLTWTMCAGVIGFGLYLIPSLLGWT